MNFNNMNFNNINWINIGVVLVLILMILYLTKRVRKLEGMTGMVEAFNADEALQNIASIYNKGNLVVSNLTVTGATKLGGVETTGAVKVGGKLTASSGNIQNLESGNIKSGNITNSSKITSNNGSINNLSTKKINNKNPFGFDTSFKLEHVSGGNTHGARKWGHIDPDRRLVMYDSQPSIFRLKST